MRGGVRHDVVAQVRLTEGVLSFKVQNAGDPKDEDQFRMRVDGDYASVTFDDQTSVSDPLRFERVKTEATVSSDWELNRLYTADDSEVSNAEMKAIFEEDQRVRHNAKTDWKVVNKTDAERREETRKLLTAGALHNGKDYEEAAFVFQHGSQPEDYLLAHTLAMVAVSKGDATAIWIAAATLDRYLEKVGQKQVFGTQYSSNAQHVWTQEPYNHNLISDALRLQLGVPSQAVQAEQLKIYQRQQ
ncbi:hypothetical protein [Tunturibacter empetritectus]|uniref:Uncharacterized protein n=1 Tax=Tunturiibacter lichenicola TaxID=2051959 RepID=A0A7W8J500_9BACT|nr:hypothetical protein [Edaphobacter lichenicola]MBB5342643.1 hypothetical protein [Edaphobacter lichenicola]